MNRLHILTLLLTLSLLVTAAAPTLAQETTTEPVTCDATLTALTLLAVRDYGYEPPIRFDIFNYVQYRTLAEAVTGMTLPEPQATISTSAGEQAEAAFQNAAADLESRGLGALGQGLADLADEAGSIVDAGEEALQQGQAAIQAGADALGSADDSGLLTYGNVSGQHEYCDLLRMDVVDFVTAQLRQEYEVE